MTTEERSMTEKTDRADASGSAPTPTPTPAHVKEAEGAPASGGRSASGRGDAPGHDGAPARDEASGRRDAGRRDPSGDQVLPGHRDAYAHQDAATGPDAPSSVPAPPPESGPRGAVHSVTGPIPERTSPAPDHGRFLTGSVESELQARWSELQASFVDGPKRAVEEADHLVADLADRLAKAVRARHGLLRASWESGTPDTEEYRVALQRYRSFVNRLITI